MTQIDGRKRFMIRQLQNAEKIFVLFSNYTRMPFVVCTEEEFNDQISIFRKEEEAKAAVQAYAEKNQPVRPVTVQKSQALEFYASLFLLGVNSLLVDPGKNQVELMLDELIKRPDHGKLPEGQVLVENPQLQLTAMYFMQALRSQPDQKPTQELKEMEEEMLTNVRRGVYILPHAKGKMEVPLLKLSDGKVYQPVFSDVPEFRKFGGANKFDGEVVTYDKLKDILPAEAAGIVINPMGVLLAMPKNRL